MATVAQTTMEKRFSRLARILMTFQESDTVSTTLLSERLGMTPRTIQRDFRALRQAGFPVKERKKGYYTLDKDLVRNLEEYTDVELALIVALKELVSQLGSPFEKAANDILGRIYDYSTCRPVFVKLDGSVRLNSRLLDRIIKAIKATRQVIFQYTVHSPYTVTADPYRVAYFDGIWYLVASDLKDSKVKKYALDKIDDLRQLRTSFKRIPPDLDAILEKSMSIWFEGGQEMEVTVEVDADWAHYFQRRSIIPTQEVLDTRKDGSLVLRFVACSMEEVKVCLKPWIPHVRILEPGELRKEFLEEFKGWIGWQESV